MKFIYLLFGLLLLTSSCKSLEGVSTEPKHSCNCDYTTAYIDGQWWVLHPKKDCPPHNKRPDDTSWVIIH